MTQLRMPNSGLKLQNQLFFILTQKNSVGDYFKTAHGRIVALVDFLTGIQNKPKAAKRTQTKDLL